MFVGGHGQKRLGHLLRMFVKKDYEINKCHFVYVRYNRRICPALVFRKSVMVAGIGIAVFFARQYNGKFQEPSK